MFILRSACLDDLNDLLELASKVKFINLPHDESLIRKKLLNSKKSFERPSSELEDNYYFFVLEDLNAQKVIGVSMIHAQHGTEREPHFFLKVSSEHKFSQTINTGFVHGTLKLGLNTDGPTEIGGLVLSPDYRGNPKKLGKQISFVRFLYMSMYPERFREEIHSELMPPLDKDGNSHLWEAIGRRFMNMDYQEADKLSRSNKEFILSLYPSENIYMTLLPYEARDAIGKVGRDTEPVRSMLESIGFQFINEVDPFDGGPHYRCKLVDIKPIKKHFKAEVAKGASDSSSENYLLSIKHEEHPFYAFLCEATLQDGKVLLDSEYLSRLGIEVGSEVVGIPF
ncbi:MAG: arginine N-succinyltransferase [Halobacteriovoraceae bacterium]|nr:arginine N-succinyltransferase [Halobacteriovoraceae bacterium]